ncbi:hypothetical protein QF041_002579 [Paenibacillus sp. W2I17]|nr:hypothetical protein [Paenibacillus sp. W2I17]
MNIGSVLTTDDYNLVQSKVDHLFHEEEEKFLLHGDTGVHNFVYDQNELIALLTHLQWLDLSSMISCMLLALRRMISTPKH